MKTIKAILPAVLIVVAALFFLGNLVSGLKFSKSKKQQTETFKKSLTVTEQKPFTFIIASFNNSEFVKKNLTSVFEQRYSNYRVIYIDDASTDNTFECAKKCIQDANQEARVTVIQNKQNLKAVENFYRAIHSCNDNEIIVFLDGDDWLAHDRVLEKLNQFYADPEVWLTYGSYIEYPSYKKGEARGEIPHRIHHNHEYRKYSAKKFIFSHLKTGYAGLFKKIKLQDLLKEGTFMAASSDQAFMIPAVEMAGEHTHFIKDIFYVYNSDTSLNDHKVHFAVQQECTRFIHSLPCYPRVPDWRNQGNSILGTDIVVISKNRPLQLYAFLESAKKNIKGMGKLIVLYDYKDEMFFKAYEEVKKAFPSFEFFKISENFKKQLINTVRSFPAHFVLFANDQSIFREPIDLRQCIERVEQSGAYGFFLNSEHSITHKISFDQTTAWQFYNNAKTNFTSALYPKELILDAFNSISFSDFESLNQPLAATVDKRGIGLIFNENKLITISIKDDADKLLSKFQEGLKIDLAPYFQTKKETAHVELDPEFISR